MKVYVLFHETNSGHSDTSDGYVEEVFATEAAALAAMDVSLRKAVADGEAVYYNPDTEEEDVNWEHDWRVEEHEVKA